MRNALLTLTLSLSLVPALGCFDSDEVIDDGSTAPDDDARHSLSPRPLRIPTGSQWGPCDLTGVDSPGWWGCDGSSGVGLACARPVSDDGLNICVPQTANPGVDDDCGNVVAPFGLGVRLQGSAYCVVDCVDDSDCAGGQLCAAAGMCAWIGQ